MDQSFPLITVTSLVYFKRILVWVQLTSSFFPKLLTRLHTTAMYHQFYPFLPKKLPPGHELVTSIDTGPSDAKK